MSLNSGQTEGTNKVVWIVLAVVVVALIAVGVVFMGKKDDAGLISQMAENESQPTTVVDEKAASASAQEVDDMSEALSGTFNGIDVQPGNPVVAKVDGEDITRVDVYRFIQLMPPQIQQMPAAQVYPLALEQTINTRIIQNKAEAANLENSPEFQQELEMAKQQIARNLFVEKMVNSKISDADLKKDYNKLMEKAVDVEQRKASHILVETKEAAQDIIKKLNDGGDFDKIAKAQSKDPTAAQNAGDLGWFGKADMVPEFADAAFAMKKGDVTKEPVKTNFGWHVIKLEDVRMQPKPSFEQIKEGLAMQKRREILEGLVRDWTKQAEIEIYDINGEPVKQVEGAAAPANMEPAAAAEPEAAAEEAPAAE